MKRSLKAILCITVTLSLCFAASLTVFASSAAGDSEEMSMEDLLSLLEMLSDSEGSESAFAEFMDYTINDITFSYPFLWTAQENGEMTQFFSPTYNSLINVLYQPDENGEVDIHDEEDIAAMVDVVGGSEALVQMDYVTICGYDALWINALAEDSGVLADAYALVLQLDNAAFVITLTSMEEYGIDLFAQIVNSISIAGVSGTTDLSNVYVETSEPVSQDPASSISSEPEPVPSADQGTEAAPAADINGIDASGSEAIVLIDNDACTVSIINNTGENEYYPLSFIFNLVNKSDINLFFSMSDVSVNGYLCDPFWGVTVAAGETAESNLYFYPSDFDTLNIETVHDLEFSLNARDDDDWFADYIFDEPFILYPNGFDAPEQKPVQFSDSAVVLLDNDDCTMIMMGFEDTLFGFSGKIYMENRSDKKITFSVGGSTAVNGIAINPYFGRSLAPGKKAIAYATWYSSDLEANGIAEAEDVTLDIEITDYDDWFAEPLYTTVVTIPVN